MTEKRLASRSWVALLLAAASLSQLACSTDQAATWATVRHALVRSAASESRPLPDGYAYLRLTVNGVPAMVALGYVDQDTLGRPVQVWYSSAGEVMRTQDGRLVGLLGTPVEWRSVAMSAATPAWADVTQAVAFQRDVDVSPGFRWGQQHALTVQSVPPPSDTALAGLSPTDLRWYAEHEVNHRALPARYAVAPASGQVVYGEQCLAPTFCLTWQTWPPTRP